MQPGRPDLALQPGQLGQPGDSAPTAGQGPSGWTATRIVSAVIGAVLVLISLGFLAAGGGALWGNFAKRDGGYVNLGTTTYRTTGYALATETIDLHGAGNGWNIAKSLFGTVHIRTASAGGTTPMFVGIATADAANRYLAGVQYATVTGAGRGVKYVAHSGVAPATPPASARLWTAHASGTGTQTLTWQLVSGNWTVVAMNADGSRPVDVRVNVSATLPSLPWIATGLLIGGVIFLAGGAVLIAVPVRRASR